MMLTSKRYRRALLLAIFSWALAWGSGAAAQESDDLQKVVDLNKKALAAFANLDVEEAQGLLKQALEVCGKQHLDQHPMAARTHIHLGVVYAAGLKQRDQSIEEFKKALRIEPTIKVTKSLINPEVQSAFQEALMDASDGGEPSSPPGSATPSATGPTPPAHPETASPAGTAMLHTPVTQAAAGQPIALRVQVPASLGAERVIVAYRPMGATEYLKLELDPVDNGDWHQGVIPAEATNAESIAYYLVASNGQGQTVGQDGTEAEPHVITLGEGASGGVTPDVGSGEDEGGETGGGLSFWASVTLGSGFGYHSGTPEANKTNDSGVKLKSSGIAVSRLVQINPEVGFFYSDNLLFSLQGRFQLVSGASEVKGSNVANNNSACKGGTCKPATLAAAALAKATWFVGEPKRVMPFLTLAAGVGQVRQVIDVGKLSGCPASGCKDTIVGGPLLFGPGAGLTIELSESFSVVASANALIGVPNFLANLDLSLGFAYVR
ncbi:MAG TPA: tetratricopeptide repeat protein [Polyangia bacterium]